MLLYSLNMGVSNGDPHVRLRLSGHLHTNGESTVFTLINILATNLGRTERGKASY